MYTEYADHRRQFADVSSLPTPAFSYGPEEGDELYIDIELEHGKSLVVRLLAVGEANDEGERNAFFELNGQPRTMKVADESLAADAHQRLKADDGIRSILPRRCRASWSVLPSPRARPSHPAIACSRSRP
jgi:pyruvate carboxylase